MLDEIVEETRQEMAEAVEQFEQELTRLRTGRANLQMLDGIKVEYYGTPTPLHQVAALNVPESRMITIKPWDKSLITPIEKAIVSSNLGLTPNNDGNLIRLPIPPLTGERRKELVKQLKDMSENARVSVRNIRREANQRIKKTKGVSEDDQHGAYKEIQKLTDEHVERVDKDAQDKENEIMEV